MPSEQALSREFRYFCEHESVFSCLHKSEFHLADSIVSLNRDIFQREVKANTTNALLWNLLRVGKVAAGFTFSRFVSEGSVVRCSVLKCILSQNLCILSDASAQCIGNVQY